jgi:hypothetical protein
MYEKGGFRSNYAEANHGFITITATVRKMPKGCMEQSHADKEVVTIFEKNRHLQVWVSFWVINVMFPPPQDSRKFHFTPDVQLRTLDLKLFSTRRDKQRNYAK